MLTNPYSEKLQDECKTRWYSVDSNKTCRDTFFDEAIESIDSENNPILDEEEEQEIRGGWPKLQAYTCKPAQARSCKSHTCAVVADGYLNYHILWKHKALVVHSANTRARGE